LPENLKFQTGNVIKLGFVFALFLSLQHRTGLNLGDCAYWQASSRSLTKKFSQNGTAEGTFSRIHELNSYAFHIFVTSMLA